VERNGREAGLWKWGLVPSPLQQYYKW